MNMKIRCSILLGVAICCTVACQTNTTAPAKKDSAGPVQPLKTAQEGIVKVQHILVGFKGTVPGKNITRTMAEAEQLAKDLTAKAKEGGDFGQLVKDNTDDSAPGIYVMADHGVDTMMYPGQGQVFNRSGMAKSFGDVSFGLKVGEVGLADYNVSDSPFGWHIIKRIE
jgi:hypothetical protein